MSQKETDRLLLNQPPTNGVMGTPPQGLFHHHHHNHHHNQQTAVTEAGFCASVVCCIQAAELCSEANDSSNSCMTRTCKGTGATVCGILGIACCFLTCLSFCANEKKDEQQHHHHHHHGHH